MRTLSNLLLCRVLHFCGRLDSGLSLWISEKKWVCIHYNNRTQGFPPFAKSYFDWQTLCPMAPCPWQVGVDSWNWAIILLARKSGIGNAVAMPTQVFLRWRLSDGIGEPIGAQVGGAFRTQSTTRSNLLTLRNTLNAVVRWEQLLAMKMSHVVFTETTTR